MGGNARFIDLYKTRAINRRYHPDRIEGILTPYPRTGISYPESIFLVDCSERDILISSPWIYYSYRERCVKVEEAVH